MYTLSQKQTVDIYQLKIQEVEMSEGFTERDKEIVKRFYKKKIAKIEKVIKK